MDNFTIYFAHGKESGPQGIKIKHLSKIADKYNINTISLDYSYTFDPDLRVEKLLSSCNIQNNRLILVGSSMGGYVSTVATKKLNPAGLFLMAPAFYMPNYKNQTPTPNSKIIWIVHGFNDDIVPFENSVKFGDTQHPTLTDYADGVDTLEFLSKL